LRVLFWYCDRFGWTPAVKTIENAPPAEASGTDKAVVAFVHVEPGDVEPGGSAETKLVKNAKWLARKWGTTAVVLHSFTHLAEAKADAEAARKLFDNVERRLTSAGYSASQTPYGYFLDLDIQAPGHPLARVFKAF
jgi:hypothetical protein